jgi:hypothetical protein
MNEKINMEEQIRKAGNRARLKQWLKNTLAVGVGAGVGAGINHGIGKLWEKHRGTVVGNKYTAAIAPMLGAGAAALSLYHLKKRDEVAEKFLAQARKAGEDKKRAELEKKAFLLSYFGND